GLTVFVGSPGGCGHELSHRPLVPVVVADLHDAAVDHANQLYVVVDDGSIPAPAGGAGEDRDPLVAGEHVENLKAVVLDVTGLEEVREDRRHTLQGAGSRAPAGDAPADSGREGRRHGLAVASHEGAVDTLD